MNPDETNMNPGRSLTDEEIAALYPGVPINRTPMTQDEKYERVVRNQRNRGAHYYRAIAGLRE